MRLASSLPAWMLFLAVVPAGGQTPAGPAAPLTVKCHDGGSAEITGDAIHTTCDGVDLRVTTSAVRNITLRRQPRFVLPVIVTPAGGVGVPLGHRDTIRLSVLGKDGEEHVLELRVEEADLVPSLAALSRLTRLDVFTDRTHATLTAAGVPQRVATYAIPARSAERGARLRDVVARSAEVTDAGEVVVVYGTGRAALWTPGAAGLRPLGEAVAAAASQPCQPAAQVVGVVGRRAAIFHCGQVTVYDIDAGTAVTRLAVPHPSAAVLHPGDGALLWLDRSGLHRRSLTGPEDEPSVTPLDEAFDRLALSPHGDVLFCVRARGAGGDAGSDLYVYPLAAASVGPPVRVRDLRGQDPRGLGISPEGTHVVTLRQRHSPKVQDVITTWELKPAPRPIREVPETIAVNATVAMLMGQSSAAQFSADGRSIVVTGTWRTVVRDAQTGAARCMLPEPVSAATRPNSDGLSVAIGVAGAEIGDLPRVLLWDAATCVIRHTLSPEADVLRGS
jgi:hypothetical protein